MGACVILCGGMSCVGIRGVFRIVVLVGVSLGGIGIYIAVSWFVSVLGVDVCEVWSCAMVLLRGVAIVE